MRTITLKQVGYEIAGNAHLKMWGGGEGEIPMIPTQIYGKLTKGRLHNAINDGQFGCEAILGVEADVYDLFEGNHKEFNRTISISEKQCQNAMRGI